MHDGHEDDAAEHLPRPDDVFALELDARPCDGGLCLLPRDDVRQHYERRRQQKPRDDGAGVGEEDRDSHADHRQGVERVEERLVAGAAQEDAAVVDLVVLQKGVVRGHALEQRRHGRVGRVVLARAGEAARQGDLFSKGELLAVGDVEPPEHPERLLHLVVRRLDGDRLDRVQDLRHQQVARGALVRLVKSHQLRRDFEGLAVVDENPRPEPVARKVVQAHGDDADALAQRLAVLLARAQSHDRDARLEREQRGAVVRPALREDANGAALVEAVVHRRVELVVVELGHDFEARRSAILEAPSCTRGGETGQLFIGASAYPGPLQTHSCRLRGGRRASGWSRRQRRPLSPTRPLRRLP
mmetsp:Transcript_28022/g.99642  ORF Transcript_28022/g.99642 Transcript_28022/m.99642 type:complete len:357 (+) Transcript_28022:643-1713(+)